jgi:hypothetical protein
MHKPEDKPNIMNMAFCAAIVKAVPEHCRPPWRYQVNQLRPQFMALFPLFLTLLLFQGCSGGASSTAAESPVARPSSNLDISQMTELSSTSAKISAAQGGTIAHQAVTCVFPAGALPADAVVKLSEVSLSMSTQDASLRDLTGVYTLSATSFTEPIELDVSATLTLRIDPAGFDRASIRLVFWDGGRWHDVPAEYNETNNTLSSTADVLLPFGTRIYNMANRSSSPVKPGKRRGAMTVTEFVAVKVVGVPTAVTQGKTTQQHILAAVAPPKAKFYESSNFIVQYQQNADLELAKAVSGYMENAYDKIVGQMGFRKPGPCGLLGSSNKWQVIFTDLGDAYGRADASNFIEIQEGTEPGDSLSHTCHHEFFHLVQYKTLRDAKNGTTDGLGWFDETTSDGVGYYAQKGLGVMYCAADTDDMGYFQARLDDDERVSNRDYEYSHFPFISYILANYGHPRFKAFFEAFYSQKDGEKSINMTSLDTVATAALGKSVSGPNGIFWDFYEDYFISGKVFNKNNFLNLPKRSNGSPFDIEEDDEEQQGVTVVPVTTGTVYPAKDFTMLRLSAQVALFRFTGKEGNPVTLNVTITSSPGQSAGRIELHAFKRVGGVLQPDEDDPDRVSDGTTKTITFKDFGKEVHEVQVLMVNTSSGTDGYRVTISATAF